MLRRVCGTVGLRKNIFSSLSTFRPQRMSFSAPKIATQKKPAGADLEKAGQASGVTAEKVSGYHTLSFDDAYDNDKVYNEWAATYDDYTDGRSYVGPHSAASKLAAYWPKLESPKTPVCVLDFGCGTGKMGVAMRQKMGPRVAMQIDGVDISSGMLEVARNHNIYHELVCKDLCKENSSWKRSRGNKYDAIVSCGVFIEGHVSFSAISHLLQYMKKDGILVFTSRETWRESDKVNFERFVMRNKNVKILEDSKQPYLEGCDAFVTVLRKIT